MTASHARHRGEEPENQVIVQRVPGPDSGPHLRVDVGFGGERLAYAHQTLARICRTGRRPDRGVPPIDRHRFLTVFPRLRDAHPDIVTGVRQGDEHEFHGRLDP